MGEQRSAAAGPQPSGGDGRPRPTCSPFVPAAVVSLIVGALAGLFVGAYSWAMAHPVPHRIPVAVTGGAAGGERFVNALEHALGTSLVLHRYPDYGSARAAVDAQRDFAILQQNASGTQVDVASAAGASVARVLGQSAPRVGGELGIPVEVRDVKPLPDTDPQGLAVFYVSLGSNILGLVGAIQLGVHAKSLEPAERIAFTALYALLGGLSICAMIGGVLGVLRLPFVQSWAICALTMFTSGAIYTAFQTFFGRWALLPAWLLLVVLGNPSSGGAVAWPLLPPVLGFLGRFLPPGASVNAQRNAIYFHHNQHLEPYVVLAAWCLAATLLFVVWRERHPGGRDTGQGAAPGTQD
ncbi:ABC transporter permease [Kitasatospora sp. NPDC052896]|uniref:ABC transporter permease n=1 Tax=Kitasatospora sp. NPDC052896 TaxID=3364061 RepID=UPI0037C9FB12